MRFKQLTKRIVYNVFLLFAVAVIISVSCKKKESIITDPSAKLSFSVDSVLFDTVFTTVGSFTKRLMVYNNNDKKINISSIRLVGGNASPFNLNIDGTPATIMYDVEIAANDSMFIFVRVTVDPTNQNSPLIINDSIVFITNGNIQDVDLIAWGQDAHYHLPDHFPQNFPAYSIVPCNDIWTNDKPHVIYGYLVVDSACTLTIQEDVKVHLHENAVLWVYKDGTLKVNGQLDHEVIFQGDRLEAWYKDLPGQWGRIWLSSGSIDNEINYAIIKNGTAGIHVDTLGNSTQPTLKLNNTKILNMSYYGLFAQGSNVEAINCVFANCGEHCVFLNIGGEYTFTHCTLANYWLYSMRQTPLLILNNYYKDINEVIQIRDLTKADFINCIIYGNNAEEILLDTLDPGLANYKFDHCLFKTELVTNNSTVYISCLKNLEPYFEDEMVNNYELQASSPAIDAGFIGIIIPNDIKGDPRDSTPDIGAYEYKAP